MVTTWFDGKGFPSAYCAELGATLIFPLALQETTVECFAALELNGLEHVNSLRHVRENQSYNLI